MRKVNQAIAAFAVYIACLLLTYYIHVRFFSVDVVFYAAMFDAAAAAVLTAVALYASGLFRAFNIFERAQLVAMFVMAGYVFAISVPTVVDRSLSIYILEKLQQRGGSIRLDAFERIFTQEYVREHRLVDVRLTEQLESGTIQIANGCVTLTTRGDAIASFGRFFRQHFLAKKRLLMGEYSDDLTDPFRNGVRQADYECR